MSDNALATERLFRGFPLLGLLRYPGQDDCAQNKDMIRTESVSSGQFLQRQMIHWHKK